MRIPFRKTKDGVTIRVKVHPRSSKKGIEGVSVGEVEVYLTSPPSGGAANEQLKEVLSEGLGVRKSVIRVIKGLSSRHKVVEIAGVEKI